MCRRSEKRRMQRPSTDLVCLGSFSASIGILCRGVSDVHAQICVGYSAFMLDAGAGVIP